MEIWKRSSNGRGEYELAGRAGNISPSQLQDMEFILDAGVLGHIGTGIELRKQGGKLRFRKKAGFNGLHLHRQIEALLLLPKSIRGESNLEPGEPVLLSNRYILSRIELEQITRFPREGKVRVAPGIIEFINQSNQDQLLFQDRIRDIVRLQNRTDELPDDLATLFNEHKNLIQAGGPVSSEAERIITRLSSAVEKIAPDYGLEVISGGDVLPFLLELANVPQMNAPPSPDNIEAEDLARRRQAARRWQRYRGRGKEGAKFRRDVRKAYRCRCVICGLSFPPTDDIRVPGVDAAHILPWATYDIDTVNNGLCLCKLHHWAFDQYLVALVPQPKNRYRIQLTDIAENAFSDNARVLSALRSCVGLIPENRLPEDKSSRPKAEFLRKLYDDLEIAVT